MIRPVEAVRWAVRRPAPPDAVAALSRALEVPPALAAVLFARGVRDLDPTHLSPPLKLSPNPALLDAAARISSALKSGKRILVHGDYDADGICGAAILQLGIEELGGTVAVFIPNRLTDGYGISEERVREHAEACDLLITVDCGVSNVREIAELKRLGVEVIVTDHHTPGSELPDCLVVHPGLSPLAGEGLPELTGAGVAFHLLWALRKRLGLEPPLEFADLAALGTIADVAPLLGENRALVLEGLARLPESRWPGVRASVKETRLRPPIAARDVAFVLAPRLNAAGRLGEAEVGLELLTTSSPRRAAELAVYLEARNLERRQIQDATFEEARRVADPEAPALVLQDPGWHSGVIGIVASKLLEEFYLPVYIAAGGRGSVRSTPGISAVGALSAASSHLRGYGGHELAAGFSVAEGQFEGFRDAIFAYVKRFPRPQRLVVADALMSADEVNGGLYRALLELEPFGEGHEEPLFALAGRLDSARAVGREARTLQLRVGGAKGVAWRMGERAREFAPGESVTAAVRLTENEWNNVKSIEFVAEALRVSEPLTLLPPSIGDPLPPLTVRRRGDPRASPRNLKLPPSASGAAGAGGWVALLAEFARVGGALELSGEELLALEEVARGYPTVSELRRGLVALRRGAPLPFKEFTSRRILRALTELSLIDEHNRALKLAEGTRRSPYDSPSFLAGLVKRYQLRTLVHAYRHLDDDSFAESFALLFGEGSAKGAPLRAARFAASAPSHLSGSVDA